MNAPTTIEIEQRGAVATLWLNRPEMRNALNPVVLQELLMAIRRLDKDKEVRVLILAGRGSAFCAGADLKWMQSAGNASADNTQSTATAVKPVSLKNTQKKGKEAKKKIAKAPKMGGLEDLLWTLHTLKKPSIARIHGPAFAGGMGLVSACDIAIASTEAQFCLTEVRIGLIPAVISPYIVRAIGQRQANRYFLSAERFDAGQALHLGLVHQVVSPEELDKSVETMQNHLLAGGPMALDQSKQLIRLVGQGRITPALRDETVRRIAKARSSVEGQEGVASFLEKRKPNWVVPRP